MALTSQIYITGLPPTAAEHDIAAHFGTIGSIKLDRRTGDAKVLLYRDRAGQLKGDASGGCPSAALLLPPPSLVHDRTGCGGSLDWVWGGHARSHTRSDL